MTNLKGFFQVLFLKILFKQSGIQIVVHVLIEPSEGPRLDCGETFGRHRLTVG